MSHLNLFLSKRGVRLQLTDEVRNGDYNLE